MQRLLIAAAMALALSCAAHAREVITCDQFGCSDWRTPAVVTAPIARASRAAGRARLHAVRGALTVAHRVSGLVAPLAAKAAEIEAACGSRVISTVRHTYVAGTRRISLHASGRAVDMQGNPSCIYAHLRDWPGGVSIDYGRVRHVHFSYDPGGREWGVRFAHGGGHRHYAKRHHKRRIARR